MNQSAYKDFYDKVGKINGWNFSTLKVISEGEQWDFCKEVAGRCKKSDVLLDIGTGGGEKLLSLADAALLLVGIDHSESMIQTAQANLLKANRKNVRFLPMEAEQLAFPSGFFQVVMCRQSGFDAREAARVLADGGVFLTQQVSGDEDKRNVIEAFGHERHLGLRGADLKSKCLADLTAAGFTDIQSFEYDATEYYASYEDLLFLLKHTPIVPDFGRDDRDFEILERFIQDYQTGKGIKTNSKRFMLIANKR